MKNVYSVIYFLIAGILTSTNADGYLKQLCDKNGGPDAYKAVQAILLKIQDSTGFLQTTGIQEYKKSHSTSFALDWEKIETLQVDVKSLTDNVKYCLRSDQYEHAEVTSKVTVSTLQFLYENPKLLEKGAGSSITECLGEKMQAVPYCASKYLKYYYDTGMNRWNTGTELVEVMYTLDMKFDKKMCSQVQEFQQCVLEGFGKCEDKIFSELLESLFKYINNDVPCENLSGSQRSEASPASVVNLLLLLFTVIAMSL